MKKNEALEVLGVDANATPDEIKKARNRKAKEVHPDKDGGSTEAMARVNEAYDILTGKASAEEEIQFRGFGGARGFGMHQEYEEFMKYQFKGQTWLYRKAVSLISLMKNSEYTIDVNGKKINFSVPAGISSGYNVLIHGEGGPPGRAGSPSGDLVVQIFVEDHPFFKRRQDDYSSVEVRVPVDFYTAIVGGSIIVPTMHGEIRLSIPKGIESGQILKISNKGLPIHDGFNNSSFGHMYFVISVHLPKEDQLDKEDITLLSSIKDRIISGDGFSKINDIRSQWNTSS